MDPFMICPEEICDKILSYLNVCDIKEASLVTMHWYTLIGRSKSCMKKLCLKPKDSHENQEFLKNILDSTRIYQNVEMVDLKNDVKKNAKYIRLMRFIVTKYADTLVSLKLSNDLVIRVDLPKIRELDLFGSNYNNLFAANGVLTRTKGLEYLKVKISFEDGKSIKFLKRFLMENKSLKVLVIYDSLALSGLNSGNIKFKLDVFEPGTFLVSRGLNELMVFMSAHKSTLKVTNGAFLFDNVSFLMSNFPKLHTLTLKCYTFIDNVHNYPFNATIKNVNIKVVQYHVKNLRFGPHIIDLIQKLQNLQTIGIGYVNSEILQALLNSRTLKTVKYCDLDVTGRDLEEMELQENIEFIAIDTNFLRF